MYYYGGYQGYGGYPYQCCSGNNNQGYGGAIILVLFILLVIVIGTRSFKMLLQTKAEEDEVRKMVDNSGEISYVEINPIKQSDFAKGFFDFVPSKEEPSIDLDKDPEKKTEDKKDYFASVIW